MFFRPKQIFKTKIVRQNCKTFWFAGGYSGNYRNNSPGKEEDFDHL